MARNWVWFLEATLYLLYKFAWSLSLQPAWYGTLNHAHSKKQVSKFTWLIPVQNVVYYVSLHCLTSTASFVSYWGRIDSLTRASLSSYHSLIQWLLCFGNHYPLQNESHYPRPLRSQWQWLQSFRYIVLFFPRARNSWDSFDSSPSNVSVSIKSIYSA